MHFIVALGLRFRSRKHFTGSATSRHAASSEQYCLFSSRAYCMLCDPILRQKRRNSPIETGGPRPIEQQSGGDIRNAEELIRGADRPTQGAKLRNLGLAYDRVALVALFAPVAPETRRFLAT